jgi:hypothetical protein
LPEATFNEFFPESIAFDDAISSPLVTTELADQAFSMTSHVLEDPSMDIFASPTFPTSPIALPEVFLDIEPCPFPISWSTPIESASYKIMLENLPWFQFQEFVEFRGTLYPDQSNHLGYTNSCQPTLNRMQLCG